MEEQKEFKALLEIVQALRQEVKDLRAEVSSLKEAKAAPAPAAPSSGLLGWLTSAPPAKPPVKKPAPAPKAAPPPQPQAQPQPAAPKPAAPQKPAAPLKPVELAAAAAPAPSGPKLSAEQFIGQNLLHYVGVLLVTMGIAFFLLWRAAHASPMERVVMSALTGAAMIIAGEMLKRRPPYDKLSNGIIGGGWTILYLTAYGAHHFTGTRVLENPATEVAFLGAAAFGMITHALALGSRAFRVYCFGLTYFIFFLVRNEVPSFEVILVLLASSAVISVETGHADVLLVSVIGFYFNYLPVIYRTVSSTTPHDTAHFLQPFGWAAAGYLLLAVLPLVPRARRNLHEKEKELYEGALSLNAVAFTVAAGGMGLAYFGHASLLRAGAFSLFLTVPGILYLIFLPKDFAPGSICPALGLLVLAGGIWSMPSPLWKMLAWMGAATTWVWIGLLFDHAAWRVSGLVMAVLTFGFFYWVQRISAEYRRAASASMFVFSALAYMASRFYRTVLRGTMLQWEEPAMEFWLYVGSASLILGFWGVLEPAPLVVVLAALAVIGEFAAVYFGRIHLWGQASALLLAAGVYTFFIDYGANLEVLGGFSQRLLTNACVVSTMLYLYFADPTPPAFTAAWDKHWSQKQHRVMLSWMALAVVGFTIYHEFDARMRLPLWSLYAALQYYLGRYRDEEHFKLQGVGLAVATAIEGFISYANAGPSLASASSAQTMIYWGSALLLLVNIGPAKDRTKPPSEIDRQSPWVFCALSMALIAFFLTKELDRLNLTLAWSVEGIVFLIAGLVFGYAELRVPALGLLGVCVAKAVLLDTSQLPLPQRVATFMVLGAVLLVASMMYVKTSNGPKDPPPGAA